MQKLFNNRHFLGLLFMLPAGVLLLLFLTYPLGLGTWLGFTDAKVGRAGVWVGLENFKYLVGDAVVRLSLFNTLFYTILATLVQVGHALAALPLRDAAAPDADHRGGDDFLGALHLHRLPADLRHHARRAAERHAPHGDPFLPARDFRRVAGRGRGDCDDDDSFPAGGD